MVSNRYDCENQWGNQVATRQTEQMHDAALGQDMRPGADAAALLIEGQIAAAKSVQTALQPICDAARAMAGAIRAGGSLYYVAAGSSGLMAAADAMELGGTFSIPASQIKILMAGGIPTTPEMPGGTEDDTLGLRDGLAGLTDRDVVLALSASGSTPYTLAAAGIARAAGTCVIAIANNQGAPLFALADHVICLPTPPEVLSGSTRMGAGTAQKIALNMLSTLMAGELGHVHDGMMVNLRADNIKLRERAAGIVCRVTAASEATAFAALNATSGDVKAAILIAAGAISPGQAKAMLKDTAGHLRPALEKLKRAET